MEKIIFIGRQGTGKTTLAKAIVLQNKGAILSPLMNIGEINRAVYYCERIAFDGIAKTAKHTKYLIDVLSSDSLCNLTHIVCCYQEAPEWLTESFKKQNNIKVFNLKKTNH